MWHFLVRIVFQVIVFQVLEIYNVILFVLVASIIHNIIYGKCTKISNTFLFLFSNKMLVFRAGIQIMVVRIPNREDPDQTASTEAV